ncbi:MAG: hypothetical protein J5629_02145 [Muribaculaceae bacterium]|nr:hypothetical protein [Muribaculaceae bacterium]
MDYGVPGLVVADGERQELEALKRFFEDNHDAIFEEWPNNDFLDDLLGLDRTSKTEKKGYLSYVNLAKLWGLKWNEIHGEGYFWDVKFQKGELHWIEDIRAEMGLPDWHKEVDDPCEGVKLDHEVLTWRDECHRRPYVDIYRLIQEKFPGIKLYVANDLYSNYCYSCSDIEGRFFPVRYVYFKYSIGYLDDEEEGPWQIMNNVKGFSSFDELVAYVKQCHGDVIASEEDIDRMNNHLKELLDSGERHDGYCVHRMRYYEI